MSSNKEEVTCLQALSLLEWVFRDVKGSCSIANPQFQQTANHIIEFTGIEKAVSRDFIRNLYHDFINLKHNEVANKVIDKINVLVKATTKYHKETTFEGLKQFLEERDMKNKEELTIIPINQTILADPTSKSRVEEKLQTLTVRNEEKTEGEIERCIWVALLDGLNRKEAYKKLKNLTLVPVYRIDQYDSVEEFTEFMQNTFAQKA